MIPRVTGMPPVIKELSLTESLITLTLFQMTRVTGKFQITLPKRLVEAFGIRVGDEVELVAAGDAIRIVPAAAIRSGLSTEDRLRLFDEGTRRINASQKARKPEGSSDRGW